MNNTAYEGRETIALSSAAFNVFVGEYALAPGFVLRISRDADRFFAQATGQGHNEIFAESQSKFFLKVVDAQLQFDKDTDGTVTRVTLLHGGRETPGKKIK